MIVIAIQDFVQSPHCATNYFQHVRSSAQGAILCKSRVAHLALITCQSVLSHVLLSTLSHIINPSHEITCTICCRIEHQLPLHVTIDMQQSVLSLMYFAHSDCKEAKQTVYHALQNISLETAEMDVSHDL